MKCSGRDFYDFAGLLTLSAGNFQHIYK